MLCKEMTSAVKVRCLSKRTTGWDRFVQVEKVIASFAEFVASAFLAVDVLAAVRVAVDSGGGDTDGGRNGGGLRPGIRCKGEARVNWNGLEKHAYQHTHTHENCKTAPPDVENSK